MMESMHTMSSTDMHIMRIPSEDDPMMMDAGNSDRPVKLFAPDQTISDQEKNMSDLVAEVEKSNSLMKKFQNHKITGHGKFIHSLIKNQDLFF